MKRIVFLTNSYPPALGGVQLAVQKISDLFYRYCSDVFVVAPYLPGRDRPNVQRPRGHPNIARIVPRLPLPYRQGLSISQAMSGLAKFPFAFMVGVVRLIRSVRALEPDVIAVHVPLEIGFYALILRHFANSSILVHLHGGEISSYQDRTFLRQLPVRMLLDRSDRVVANSKQLLKKADLISRGVIEKGEVVGNGVDVSLMRLRAREQPPLIEDSYIFAYGRFVREKGFDVLIRSVEMIDNNLLPDKIIIAGQGPCQEDLEKLARRVSTSVEFLFWGRADRREVSILLKNCVLCTVPSREEAFGIVNLEALAMGAPLVATSAGGIPEYLEDGVHARLVDPGSSEALAKGISSLLRDEDFRNRIARTGSKYVENHWDWSRVGKRLRKAYLKSIP